jgi:DNA-binding GntR family transcriptional regulator
MAGTPIKTKLADDVANYLRKAIIEGVYPPNHHLNESELAKELAISRGPIREAINQLEADGLVFTPSNGRTRVLKFDGSDYDDYLKLRRFLESEACKLIMAHAPEDPTFSTWLSDAKQDLEQLARSIESKMETVTNRYDYSFHDNLLEKSGSLVLLRAWKSISGVRRSIMETNMKYAATRRNDYFKTHMGILEGIESGSVALMEEKLDEHFSSGRAHFTRMLQLTRGV